MKITGWGLVLLGVIGGCRSKPEVAHEAGTAARNPPAPVASSAAPSSAQAALDRMDSRTPVPLLPMMAHHQKQNMRDHLAAVQQIVAAVATKDFTAVEKAAARIGYSESMGQMCAHMGAGAPGFTDQAVAFHREADQIGAAGRKRDAEAVLASLAQTLGRCTGCHEQYKQHVVDEGGWSAAAGGEKSPKHPAH